jgi:hypothetical protein
MWILSDEHESVDYQVVFKLEGRLVAEWIMGHYADLKIVEHVKKKGRKAMDEGDDALYIIRTIRVAFLPKTLEFEVIANITVITEGQDR